jgi:hypothetical protein
LLFPPLIWDEWGDSTSKWAANLPLSTFPTPYHPAVIPSTVMIHSE